MTKTTMNWLGVISICAALAACSVGDDGDTDGNDTSDDDQPYCGPYPHFVFDGYECVPSCGAAGGTSCTPSACAGHELLRSWDCDVCCTPAPDECQANDTRCEGTTLIYCDTHSDPNRLIVVQCPGEYGPGYENCTEYSDDLADCSQ